LLAILGVAERLNVFGTTRWETIFGVLLPAGVSGILGAAILALGRAWGNDGSDNGDW